MAITAEKPPSRRGFLELLVAFGTFVSGAVMAIPGLMYMWPAAKGGGPARVEVDGAARMSPGQGVIMQVGSEAVIVIRGRDGFSAYSAVCTHLGCLVKWDSGRQEFLCPCHAAVFDKDGQVVSGPPPAALPPFVVKEVGDKVFVTAA